MVGVDSERKAMNSSLSKMLNFIEGFNGVSVINHEMELI